MMDRFLRTLFNLAALFSPAIFASSFFAFAIGWIHPVRWHVVQDNEASYTVFQSIVELDSGLLSITRHNSRYFGEGSTDWPSDAHPPIQKKLNLEFFEFERARFVYHRDYLISESTLKFRCWLLAAGSGSAAPSPCLALAAQGP